MGSFVNPDTHLHAVRLINRGLVRFEPIITHRFGITDTENAIKTQMGADSVTDFDGKIELDVGAGSGRLTFAAAEKALWVYASEPVGTLREFMRDKIAKKGTKNIRVLDGFIMDLPFPDDTFDIVMSGHVIGDNWDHEIAEITRVCRSDGWLLNCPGDSERDMKPCAELTSRGWEEIQYVGSFGKDVYVHRKLVEK